MIRIQEEGSGRDWTTWNNLKSQLEEEYKTEEEFWAKKARIEWLQERDKNTRFSMKLLLK